MSLDSDLYDLSQRYRFYFTATFVRCVSESDARKPVVPENTCSVPTRQLGTVRPVVLTMLAKNAAQQSADLCEQSRAASHDLAIVLPWHDHFPE